MAKLKQIKSSKITSNSFEFVLHRECQNIWTAIKFEAKSYHSLILSKQKATPKNEKKNILITLSRIDFDLVSNCKNDINKSWF